MSSDKINLLLADDDIDDRMFFKDALAELPILTNLQTVSDGVELMHFLTTKEPLPDLLFLDLNMPRKAGLECLSEIKHNEKLKPLHVIVYSTSLDYQVANLLFEKGAFHYIRKPADFENLKDVIHKAIRAATQNPTPQSTIENFIIKV